MRGGPLRGYLKRHWVAFSLALLIAVSEALILTQAPVGRSDKGEATQNAGNTEQASRPIPPLVFAWVPIRDRIAWVIFTNLRFIDRYHDTLNAVSTLAVAIFTATLWQTTRGLFIAGEKQIGLAVRNAVAAEKAAEAATNALVGGNRAWIKASARLADGLQFNGSAVVASVIVDCSNVGNSPAIKLGHHVWIRSWDVSVIRPDDELQDLCERSRSQQPFHEFVLFAGESFPEVTQLGTWRFVADLSEDEIWRTDLQKGEGIFSLFIMGCVNYTFPADSGKMHQTRFMYELWRPKAAKFKKDDFPLSLTDVIIRKTILAAGNYAD